MNYEHAKEASFSNGFDTRLQQMVEKSARAAAIGRMFGRVAPRIEAAAPRATMDIAGGAGRLMGRMAGAPVSMARGLGRAVMGTPGEAGILSRMVGGAGEGFLGAFGEGGKRLGKSFNQMATGRVTFGQPKPMAAGAAPAGAPGAAPTPTAAPGTVGGGATPGTITPDQLSQMATEGMVTPGAGSGFTMPGRGLVGPGVDPSVLGDPTKGLLGRIKGMLPQGAQDWVAANPNLASAGAGALGGGGLVYAGNAYGDAQRRKALENLGMLDRLGLAFQLATNPQGFASTLRL